MSVVSVGDIRIFSRVSSSLPWKVSRALFQSLPPENGIRLLGQLFEFRDVRLRSIAPPGESSRLALCEPRINRTRARCGGQTIDAGPMG
jgi:hypothetical protein